MGSAAASQPPLPPAPPRHMFVPVLEAIEREELTGLLPRRFASFAQLISEDVTRTSSTNVKDDRFSVAPFWFLVPEFKACSTHAFLKSLPNAPEKASLVDCIRVIKYCVLEFQIMSREDRVESRVMATYLYVLGMLSLAVDDFDFSTPKPIGTVVADTLRVPLPPNSPRSKGSTPTSLADGGVTQQMQQLVDAAKLGLATSRGQAVAGVWRELARGTYLPTVKGRLSKAVIMTVCDNEVLLAPLLAQERALEMRRVTAVASSPTVSASSSPAQSRSVTSSLTAESQLPPIIPLADQDKTVIDKLHIVHAIVPKRLCEQFDIPGLIRVLQVRPVSAKESAEQRSSHAAWSVLMRLQAVREAIVRMMETEAKVMGVAWGATAPSPIVVLRSTSSSAAAATGRGASEAGSKKAAMISTEKMEHLTRLAGVSVVTADSLGCSWVDIRRPMEPLVDEAPPPPAPSINGPRHPTDPSRCVDDEDDVAAAITTPPAATDIEKAIVYVVNKRTHIDVRGDQNAPPAGGGDDGAGGEGDDDDGASALADAFAIDRQSVNARRFTIDEAFLVTTEVNKLIGTPLRNPSPLASLFMAFTTNVGGGASVGPGGGFLRRLLLHCSKEARLIERYQSAVVEGGREVDCLEGKPADSSPHMENRRARFVLSATVLELQRIAALRAFSSLVHEHLDYFNCVSLNQVPTALSVGGGADRKYHASTASHATRQFTNPAAATAGDDPACVHVDPLAEHFGPTASSTDSHARTTEGKLDQCRRRLGQLLLESTELGPGLVNRNMIRLGDVVPEWAWRAAALYKWLADETVSRGLLPTGSGSASVPTASASSAWADAMPYVARFDVAGIARWDTGPAMSAGLSSSAQNVTGLATSRVLQVMCGARRESSVDVGGSTDERIPNESASTAALEATAPCAGTLPDLPQLIRRGGFVVFPTAQHILSDKQISATRF